jgi:hypothetical protein
MVQECQKYIFDKDLTNKINEFRKRNFKKISSHSFDRGF